jgi:hypothetical protein
MFNMVDRTDTLPYDEDASWASDGTQRRISSDSESIFRDLHCATTERYGLLFAPTIIRVENITNLE